ncbi:MAG: CoA-binding protein [Candidatus Altiarchaeota archaeon]|nr:CoA-binding protein [Candidatus Altiarchaeota archaeon]
MEDGDFLRKANVVAVVGVSIDPAKWGYKLYNALKPVYSRVYAVNPRYGKVDGVRCYPDLRSLPEKPDVVVTVVPPKVTEAVVEVCRDLGIRRIWMQPGSESEKAIDLCRSNGIEVIYNCCLVVDGLGGGF